MDQNKVYSDHGCIKFLTGDRNCLFLVYNNYLYKRTNGNFPATTWRCKEFKLGCSVTVSTFNGTFKKCSRENHIHPVPVDEISIMQTKMRIKERVKTELGLSPRQIHMQERTKLHLQDAKNAHLLMDSYSKQKSSLYRYRRETFPKLPTSRKDINLPTEWTLTLDKSEQFLLIDDGTVENITVFGTENNLEILCNAKYVIADGTFKVQPDLFSQLYVFHAPHLGKVIPLLFCLLPNKTSETYVRLLTLIRNSAIGIGCEFNPPKIHIDYEMATIKAISQIFSMSVIQGCLFHYSQCLWRKVQELGMVKLYENDKNVRCWIRRFSALPFLPLSDIDMGYESVSENAPDPLHNNITGYQIQAFHDYMVETWVDDIDSKFDRKIWNQFENEGPRTTNNAEGWNHKLNYDAKSRMSLYQFIYFLQCMQVDLDASKFDRIKESPSRINATTSNANQAIEFAKYNYVKGSVPILNFLDSVSSAIKLQ